MSEHDLQTTVFDWVKLVTPSIPELGNYFAIPNGGQRHPAVAAKLKKEGVISGVPDTFLAIPNNKYHGLFIEHKYRRGQLSLNQKTWISKLQNNGYLCVVSNSFEQSQQTLLTYIG